MRQVGRWVPDHGDRHARGCDGSPYGDPAAGAKAGEGIARLNKPAA